MQSIEMTSSPVTPVLAAVGLTKTYGRGDSAVRAVDGVNLELSPGEMVAIMGASGSGKTTLLHLLAGLARLDSGSVHIGGKDLAKMSDSAATSLRGQQIGVVFQAYNLMPTLTAVDNVALPLLLAGTNRSRARTAALERLEVVGMAERAKRRPPQLSGGEQQRVAVARALVNDPQIVLADEPTGNLDRKNAHAICQLLRDVVVTTNRAVAIVTHDPLVADYADRIVVLADGRVADAFLRNTLSSIEALSIGCLHAAQSTPKEHPHLE